MQSNEKGDYYTAQITEKFIVANNSKRKNGARMEFVGYSLGALCNAYTDLSDEFIGKFNKNCGQM